MPVNLFLARIEHDHNEVSGSRDSDDLLAAALALRRPLDYARQVKQLYLGAVVHEIPRDAR